MYFSFWCSCWTRRFGIEGIDLVVGGGEARDAGGGKGGAFEKVVLRGGGADAV